MDRVDGGLELVRARVAALDARAYRRGMAGRFQPGDHLQVRRPSLYFHQCIYVSDDHVIQFGSSVTLRNKAVTLEDFEQCATARVVRDGYGSCLTGHHPAADEPWKIVARAEFLLKLHPMLPYNLIGHNCEIIANMCASGSWTGSYQSRRFFTVRTAMDIPLMFFIASRSRRKLPVPGWVWPVAVLGFVATVAVKTTYDDQIRRLWKEIRADWQAHERMVDSDPRNGLSCQR
jgi:hypothetical protein